MTKFDYLFCFIIAGGLMASAINNDWFSAFQMVLIYAAYEYTRKKEVSKRK